MRAPRECGASSQHRRWCWLDRPDRPGDDEKEIALSVGTSDPLDAYVDAVAKALKLPIEDAWKPAIKANLDVSLRLARVVDEFPLSDDTEPACVFAA
jgi:hypothetical protein